nr:MAG TPA: hypothetical protein [Caudoviricetes sp.]
MLIVDYGEFKNDVRCSFTMVFSKEEYMAVMDELMVPPAERSWFRSDAIGVGVETYVNSVTNHFLAVVAVNPEFDWTADDSEIGKQLELAASAVWRDLKVHDIEGLPHMYEFNEHLTNLLEQEVSIHRNRTLQ